MIITSESDDQYSLALSTQKFGKLVPILKDAKGNIIDGKHRLDVDANWPSLTLENITDELQLTVARLITNVCRRKVDAYEKTQLLGKIKELRPNWTVSDIAEATGMSERWVLFYLPDEYKDKKMQEIRAQRIDSHDNVASLATTPDSTKEVISKTFPCDLCGVVSSTNVRWNNRVNVCPVCLEKLQHPEPEGECERCHVVNGNIKEWEGHKLCPIHYAKALEDPAQTKRYFQLLDAAKKKPIPEVNPHTAALICPKCGYKFFPKEA